MSTLNIDTNDRLEQRKFGLLMAAACFAIGLLRWWLKGSVPVVFPAIGTVFLVPALLFPAVLRPAFRLWIRFAETLNWIITRILLGAVFYAMITPAALIMRLLGKDPLNRAFLPDAPTYWEAPDEQSTDIENYRRQF